MAYFLQPPGINFIQAIQNQAYVNSVVATIQQLQCNAKDALEHNDNEKALDAYNRAITLGSQIRIPPEDFGKLLCNRSLVYYNLKDYKRSLLDATQVRLYNPGFYKGYFRQGLAYKSLNEPVNAVSCFISTVNICKQTNGSTQDLVVCYAELVNVLCEVEDIFDFESYIIDPESNTVKDLIIQRLSSNGQWKAISYLLIGAITGADSKLAGSFSNCNCSSLSVLKLFTETIDIQKKEWGCKLAIKLLQNGASFQEFENGLDGKVVHFGVTITLKTGNVEFLKYLLSTHINTTSKMNVKLDGDTALHVLVKDLEIRKTTIGETIIGLLINHGCGLDIKDSVGKTAIEYTSKSDQVFSLLQNALNSSKGRGISANITRIRRIGKDALQAGNLDEALKIYTKGLKDCSDEGDFKNEAILYTNRATVYNKLTQHEMALQDAESAIQADPTWHKAHWRKGKELYLLNIYDKAFETFIHGFEVFKLVCDDKDLVDLIIGAVIAFPNIPDNLKATRYEQLLNTSLVQFLPDVLNRLSKESEWRGISYLILGLSTDVPLDHAGYGVACSVDTSKMQLSTVLNFIEENKTDKLVANWLTPTLIVLLFKHDKQFLNFKHDAMDYCIHAAVKYALITGDVRLLEQMPVQGTPFFNEYLNGNNESPYHVITKNGYTQDCQLMKKVVLILNEKNFTASFRDNDHRLPIDYVLKQQFGELHEELMKISWIGERGLKTQDQLLEQVQKELSQKDYTAALKSCFSALLTFDTNQSQGINKKMSSLLIYMSECHLNLRDVEAALITAGDSVMYNPTCDKAHYMLGNVLHVHKRYQTALQSYINALVHHCNSRTFPTTDISRIVEILKKICIAFILFHNKRVPTDIQASIPIQVSFDIWVDVLYRFILEENLEAAKYIEQFIRTIPIIHIKLDYDLQPLCNMEILEKFPDCMFFIAYLIRCGCKYSDLSTEKDDTFITAAVRMACLTGIPNMLKDICVHVQAGQISNIRDCKGNSGLHVAAAQKINTLKIGRHEVIEILITTDINPYLKNNDGKLAIDLLPKDDKRSKKVLLKYMKTKTAFEDVKQTDHHSRESSPATQLKSDAVLKQSQTTEKQIQKLEKQINNVEDKCKPCQDTFNKCKTIILDNPSIAFKDLLRLIKSKHRHPRHKQIEEESVLLISDFLAESTDFEIPDELCKIPQKSFDKILHYLMEQEKWIRIYKLVTKHNREHGIQSLSGFASEIRIEQLISHLVKELPNEKSSKFIEEVVHCFIFNGGRVDPGGQICISNAVERQWYKLLNTMICDYNCDPQYLNIDSCSTPIHSALILGLHKDPGNFSVFNKCLELFAKNPVKYARLDPKQRDRNGDTLFHLVVKETCNTLMKQAAELLQQKHVPCKVQNKDGKFPLDYLKAGDPRYKILHKAMEYDTSQMKSAEKQKKANNEPTINKPTVEKRKDHSVLKMECYKDKPKQTDKTTDSKPLKQPKITNESYLSQIQKLIDSISSKQSILEHSSGDPCKEINLERISVASGDVDESEIDQMELGIWHGSLEGKPWEVECTSGVLKSLQSNRIKPVYKERIVKIINALASGIYSKSFFKPLVTGSDRIKLFESKISSASRLIWEVGKQFSPRLTMRCEQQVNVYTDIIRIWEVVMEHKNIHQAVERIVSSIEKSHEKGASCLIQKKLCGMKAGSVDLNTQQNNQNNNRELKTPNIYVESDHKNLIKEISFFPPASSKDTEYSTIKFYTFSSNVALNILHQMKGEFPFRVTDVEYQITNLPFDAPIVLIGRSGTGKTTCCVYRLWYRFQQYWWPKIMDEATPDDVQSENTDHCKEKKEDIRETCVPNKQGSMNDHVVDESLHAEIGETNGQGSGACFAKSSFACEEDESNQCNAGKIDAKDSMRCDENDDELRQIFITKNGVLCREVQKMFKSFIDGDEKTSRLFKTKDDDLPNCLQDIKKLQYPVFITAKHFWLMVDATLGPPYYFDRHIDGSPKSEIEGWTDIDDMQTILDDEFDSEYSDESESDEEEQEMDLNITLVENKRTRMKKVDPRREVTYEVFEDVIWPRIIGKFKKHKGKYHPSLVWTEIMSIIKGSYGAIYDGGFLNKNRYFEIGKKQAPAFVDEREILYNFFLEYEHIRQNRHMFDQTDLVQNLYQRCRKQKNSKWKVNEIYVDEAQDFAQAELFLLIKLCESPHGMFVTGDTAQSIMKGIAFRFKDLVSLFHYASKDSSVKTVGVSVQPDRIYELPHNYRSHSGITALATSVLDVLKDLFPDSFDSLPNDQCLFKGPKPVLLETVSSNWLSLILCENVRETSKIEFGAHQAILVVNDKARDNIPEEMKSGLVLTLYEAKGLEFDDVLLYNIFTDSEATKEWRVVLSFLEKLVKKDSKNESKISLQISADSRPLPFNPKQHKVLNSELKQLYTAITRARQNVWIFDEDKEQRTPIFEYFQALHLVEVVAEDKEVKSFTRKSTPREWVDKGEEFMKLKMYTQAAQCFKTAGDSRMEDMAHAYQHYKTASIQPQNSPHRKDELLQATLKFLETKKTKEAAKCLETAKQFDLAAKVYIKRQQFEKAAEMYRRSKNPLESCKYYERAGRFEKSIDVLLENKQFEEAIHSLNRYQENHDPEKPKVRDNQTEDQINRNAAEYYHKQRDSDEMKKALNRIRDISFRVKFLKERFDGENDYIKLATSIYMENGQTRNAASLYFDYGYTQEALPLFRKDKETYMIGRCLYLDSLLKISIRPDGSAICNYSSSLKEMTLQLEQAIFYFKKCQYKDKDRKCNFGKITDEIAESNLLLGRLTGQQHFIGTAFNNFRKRMPQNEVGKLECLGWMINNSNLRIDSNLSKVMIGMENLLNIFSFLVPFTKQSTKFTERNKEQFLKDNGIETEIGLYFYNPIHKPRILEVQINVPESVTRKTVKTVVNDVTAIYNVIVEDLLTKGKLWFCKIRKLIEDERQKLKGFNKPLGKSQNIGDRSPKVSITKVCFTHSEFLQLIRLDMHNVKLEIFLDECNTKLCLNREQKFILNQSDQRSFQFSKCRRLMEDLIHTIPHISNKKWDLFESLNGVRSQMEFYFESELASSKKIEKSVARFFELIFFKKIFGLQQKVNDSLTNLESTVLHERKKNSLSRQKAYSCGFISKTNVQYPFALSVVRSFKESLDCLKLYHNPYKALKKFSIFIWRMNKQLTEETIPELTLLLIWVRYFTLVGLSLQSKFCGIQNFGKKCHFVIPSSYITTSKFVERCMFYSNAWTTDAIIYASKEVSISDDIPDLLEKNIEILAGIRGNINIISIIFRRLDEHLQLQESSEQLTKEDNALSSVIDMAEDVISLAMVYIINMGESMSYYLEPFLLKEFALLRCSERYPKNISEAIHGIQTSSGIADICMCVTNFLKQKGDSLIKCAWDNQKKYISKEQIESVFNTRESFFLPQTLRILSNPTSSAKETMEEVKTIQEEIEIDEEEIRTVREDHVTVEKKKNEDFILQTLKAKENLQCKVIIGYDEFLDDPLFSVLSVNEAGCDVCGCTFECIGDDEEEDGAGITTNHERVPDSPSSPTVSMSLKSIARSFSATTGENIPEAKAQSRIPNEQIVDVTSSRSARSVSQRSVSLESEENQHFIRSLSSTSDDQGRLNMQSFEEHIVSFSHKTEMKQVQIFYEDYRKNIKPGLEKVRQFITKYELSSGDISERYGEDEIRISQLLTRFEELNTDLAEMIRSKHWKPTRAIEKKLQELVQLKSKLRDSVKELSSVKLKTDIAEPHNDIVELEYKPQNEKKKRRNKGRGKKD